MAGDKVNPGLGVDASGNPVIDPTANVLNLVEAAVTRLDDLREKEAAHVREVLQLRADLRNADLEKVNADLLRIDTIARLQAEHASELRRAEADRIDAVRAIDVQNVSRAAEVAATQATTLAAQVATSAETLRNQVSAAAAASTTALAAALEPIQKRIEDLSRAQYEQQGQKAQVTESRASTSNVGTILGAAGGVIALLFAAAALYLSTQDRGVPTVPVNPPPAIPTTPAP